MADSGSAAAVNVREIRRSFDRSRLLPGSLVSEIAETTSLAQNEWAEARAASDFARFQPWLEKLLVLFRQKAECLGWGEDGEPFDALLDGFEPGATASELHALFSPLRDRLTDLLDAVRGGTPPSSGFASAEFPITAQEELVRFVVERIGFDFDRGRMDRSTHPFSVGTHCSDVRITNRYREDGLLDSLGSGMHEAGHGIYEQGLLAEHTGTPLGSTVSLGIHESQSRLWENQVGRGLPFLTWCHTQLPRFLGSKAADHDLEDLYGAANLVRPDYIRVEADEATYNLHVMVRFELELRMLRQELPVSDVPAEWNRLYRDYLGLEVPDDRRGCLQDVHWSCGLFGYFPTYTLGNLYAAQFYRQALADHGDLEDQFARGEFGGLKSWLNQHVHAHGQRWRAKDLCMEVCGSPLSPEPFLDYLEQKLRRVYQLR